MTEHDTVTEIKIFEAASEVFIERGMDGARMQDIADRAGINKSLLHYYYRSKEKLFNAVFEETANKMLSRFAPIFDETLNLEEKIRFFFREHISFLNGNPGLPAFLLNEMNRNPERIKKLIGGLDINGVWTTFELQHKNELEKYNITRELFPQLMTSIAALSVFPFAAKELISAILDRMGQNFEDYIEKRREYAADFVIGAIKKK